MKSTKSKQEVRLKQKQNQHAQRQIVVHAHQRERIKVKHIYEILGFHLQHNIEPPARQKCKVPIQDCGGKEVHEDSESNSRSTYRRDVPRVPTKRHSSIISHPNLRWLPLLVFLPSLPHCLAHSPPAVTSLSQPVSQCGSQHQSSILTSMPACSPRHHLLETRHLLPSSNITVELGVEEVVQVMPDVVWVERCGGGCHMPGHRCAPSQVEVRQVEVMVVMARWPQGEHQVVCTSLQVEEHSSCTCGCRVRPQHCSATQTYHPASCSCLCSNLEERATCLREGKTWDQEECRCRCPAHAWTSCSTGYIFDFSGSCSCVLISLVSSEALLTTAVLLAIALAGAVVGVAVMRGRGKVETSQRTLLLSQVSRRDYEERLEGAGQAISLVQFDSERISGPKSDGDLMWTVEG